MEKIDYFRLINICLFHSLFHVAQMLLQYAWSVKLKWDQYFCVPSQMRIFINVGDVWRSSPLWILSSNINSAGAACVLSKTIRFVCFIIPLYRRILYPEWLTVHIYYSSKNPKKMYHGFHKSFTQNALLIIINVSWAANQHIRMISEGSRDAEDWSNDAENSDLHHKNLLHF